MLFQRCAVSCKQQSPISLRLIRTTSTSHQSKISSTLRTIQAQSRRYPCPLDEPPPPLQTTSFGSPCLRTDMHNHVRSHSPSKWSSLKPVQDRRPAKLRIGAAAYKIRSHSFGLHGTHRRKRQNMNHCWRLLYSRRGREIHISNAHRRSKCALALMVVELGTRSKKEGTCDVATSSNYSC
jgi:hypothetical protein